MVIEVMRLKLIWYRQYVLVLATTNKYTHLVIGIELQMAYYPKVVRTNEIARSVIITSLQH